MLTLGREREKASAASYVRDPTQVAVIHGVIDAAHDLLEGSTTEEAISRVIRNALVSGGSGVWEQAGSWLLKLSTQFESLSDIWRDIAAHRSARVRFRAAAHIYAVPESIFLELLPHFLTDPSAKIRRKVAGDLGVSPRASAIPLLEARVSLEPNDSVASELRRALDSARRASPSGPAA